MVGGVYYVKSRDGIQRRRGEAWLGSGSAEQVWLRRAGLLWRGSVASPREVPAGFAQAMPLQRRSHGLQLGAAQASLLCVIKK